MEEKKCVIHEHNLANVLLSPYPLSSHLPPPSIKHWSGSRGRCTGWRRVRCRTEDLPSYPCIRRGDDVFIEKFLELFRLCLIVDRDGDLNHHEDLLLVVVLHDGVGRNPPLPPLPLLIPVIVIVTVVDWVLKKKVKGK